MSFLTRDPKAAGDVLFLSPEEDPRSADSWKSEWAAPLCRWKEALCTTSKPENDKKNSLEIV